MQTKASFTAGYKNSDLVFWPGCGSQIRSPEHKMMKAVGMKILLACMMTLSVGGAEAQTATLSLSGGSGAPGGSVPVTISFAGNGTQATGIQWTMDFSAADFGSVTFAAIPGVTAVGQSLSCSSGTNQATCVLINPTSNAVVVPDGAIAVATFNISTSSTNTVSAITLSGLIASNANGTGVALTGTGATININQTTILPVIKVPGPVTTRPGQATTFNVSAKDPRGLAVSISVSGLPPDAAFDANSGLFTWVPLTSQFGIYTVQFTATNSVKVSVSQNVVIHVGSDKPVVVALQNAASYADDGCSPGSIATLRGAGFVKTAGQSAQAVPIPTELNGVRLKANNIDLPLFYAGEFQLNFQCPQLAPGAALSLVVESKTGTSSPAVSTVQYVTPGVFSLDESGTGQGAILIANSATVAMPPTKGIPSRPAKRGEFISIFATGLGPVTLDVPIGQQAPSYPLAMLTAPIDVLIGGVKAQVEFAGLAPGFAGLYQVNARIPAEVPDSNAVSVQIVADLPTGSNVMSHVVTIAVAGAAN